MNEAQREDVRGLDLFILSAADRVLEPFPGTGIAPVHGRVTEIGDDRHVGVYGDAKLRQEDGNGYGLAARQEEVSQRQEQPVEEQIEVTGDVGGVDDRRQRPLGE